MKFSCDKESILKEIAVAYEIIATRNAISILSNVLLEADEGTLIIKASDLKVTFETRIPVITDIPGTTTVFCDKFLNILRTLPDGIVVFEQGETNKLSITSGEDIIFQLHSIVADKFPEIPRANENSYFSIEQKRFIEMISLTVFSVGTDETRYFMNGNYLEKDNNRLVMVATDGRRLSISSKELDTDIPEFNGIIIPPKALILIKKLASGEGDLKIAIEDKTLFIRFDNQSVTSSLIDAKFPNYSKVIPDGLEHEVIVDRLSLLNGIKRVSLLVDKNSMKIQMVISESKMCLKSTESEVGIAEETINCKSDVSEAKFSLNYIYLTDPLKAMEEEEIKLKFTNIKKAVILSSSPESFHYHVIMPIQKG